MDEVTNTIFFQAIFNIYVLFLFREWVLYTKQLWSSLRRLLAFPWSVLSIYSCESIRQVKTISKAYCQCNFSSKMLFRMLSWISNGWWEPWIICPLSIILIQMEWKIVRIAILHAIFIIFERYEPATAVCMKSNLNEGDLLRKKLADISSQADVSCKQWILNFISSRKCRNPLNYHRKSSKLAEFLTLEIRK